MRLEYDTPLYDAAFSPNGRLFVTAGEDGTAHRSSTEFADVLDLARQRVTRSLTEKERARYLGEEEITDGTIHYRQ